LIHGILSDISVWDHFKNVLKSEFSEYDVFLFEYPNEQHIIYSAAA